MLLNNSKNKPDELLKSTQSVVIELLAFGRLKKKNVMHFKSNSKQFLISA